MAEAAGALAAVNFSTRAKIAVGISPSDWERTSAQISSPDFSTGAGLLGETPGFVKMCFGVPFSPAAGFVLRIIRMPPGFAGAAVAVPLVVGFPIYICTRRKS